MTKETSQIIHSTSQNTADSFTSSFTFSFVFVKNWTEQENVTLQSRGQSNLLLKIKHSQHQFYSMSIIMYNRRLHLDSYSCKVFSEDSKTNWKSVFFKLKIYWVSLLKSPESMLICRKFYDVFEFLPIIFHLIIKITFTA